MRNDTAQWLKRTITIAAILGGIGLMACGTNKGAFNRPADNANATANANTAPTTQSPFEIKDSPVIEKLSPFDHNRKEHITKTQDCAFCHQRPDNSDTPILPKHPACQECHLKDFNTPTSKMCESCHKTPINIDPKDPESKKKSLISFPNKLNQFGLKGFSHRQHDDPKKMEGQMDDAAKMPDGKPSCTFCHNFESSAVAAKFPDHPQCYSCHAHQPKDKQSDVKGKHGDCGICHAKREQSLVATRGPGQALSLYNFKHSANHLKAACDRCHKTVEVPEKVVRADIQEISTARGQRHNSTCWTCHTKANEPRCTKCHVGSLPF